jgi:hypothetical protein
VAGFAKKSYTIDESRFEEGKPYTADHDLHKARHGNIVPYGFAENGSLVRGKEADERIKATFLVTGRAPPPPVVGQCAGSTAECDP